MGTAMSSQYAKTCSAITTPASASKSGNVPSVKVEVLSGHPCGTPEYMVKVFRLVGRVLPIVVAEGSCSADTARRMDGGVPPACRASAM